jgi:hypothetical protein
VIHTPPAAIQTLFGILRSAYPDVLRSLRDESGVDEDVARRWAIEHSLNSDLVVAHASFLRERWAGSPTHAKRLTSDILFATASYRAPSEAETAWIAKTRASEFGLPMPGSESLAEWQRRSAEMYRELESIIFGGQRPDRPPPRRRVDLRLWGSWFVRLQLTEESASELARTVGVDRKTVLRGQREFARRIKAKPRTRRPGGDNRSIKKRNVA